MNNNDNLITFMDAMLYAMEGENPSKAIENREKRGQQSVVRNQRLPKMMNDHSVPNDVRWNGVTKDMQYSEERKIIQKNNIEYTRKQYEKMGIVIVKEYNDLFWDVTLPEGWKIEATDHSMWNNLFDNKGRKRADFFYKICDDAFINFNKRYHIGVDHIADVNSDFEIWKKSDYQGVVKDGEEIIFSTECIPISGNCRDDDKIKDTLHKQLCEYMDKNYPEYKDIHAYWD